MARRPEHDAVFAVAEGDDLVIACVRSGVITALRGGSWYVDTSQFSDSMADRLMSQLGLTGKGEAAAIDVQVDRLLASLGIDTQAPGTCLLVAPGEPPPRLSPRWTVMPPVGVQP